MKKSEKYKNKFICFEMNNIECKEVKKRIKELKKIERQQKN